MGGGEKEITTYRYTVTTRMTRALRWAAMSESHFNVSLIVKTASTDTTFEEKGEPKRIRTEVPLFTSLTVTPVQTGTSVTGRVYIYSTVLCSRADSLCSCRMWPFCRV